MAATRPARRSTCPIAMALDVVGDRWSLLVVRDLLFAGPRTYQDLAAAPEGIATNILADRLARLTAAGILERTPDPADRRRALYSLTAKGMDLSPVLFEMVLWSARYHRTGAPPEILTAMQQDRAGYLEKLRARWEASRPAPAGARKARRRD